MSQLRRCRREAGALDFRYVAQAIRSRATVRLIPRRATRQGNGYKRTQDPGEMGEQVAPLIVGGRERR